MQTPVHLGQTIVIIHRNLALPCLNQILGLDFVVEHFALDSSDSETSRQENQGFGEESGRDCGKSSRQESPPLESGILEEEGRKAHRVCRGTETLDRTGANSCGDGKTRSVMACGFVPVDLGYSGYYLVLRFIEFVVYTRVIARISHHRSNEAGLVAVKGL